MPSAPAVAPPTTALSSVKQARCFIVEAYNVVDTLMETWPRQQSDATTAGRTAAPTIIRIAHT
ncbi:MAG: hypothetical protein ACRDTD_11490 [Pseudonocardiaceae bacterium]